MTRARKKYEAAAVKPGEPKGRASRARVDCATGCGRKVRRDGADVCRACEAARKRGGHFSPAPSQAERQEVSGEREARIARYTERAGKRLPLFD